jgi:hypothetical protein
MEDVTRYFIDMDGIELGLLKEKHAQLDKIDLSAFLAKIKKVPLDSGVHKGRHRF